MLLIPLLALSTIGFLSFVAMVCDVAEARRLTDLAERLPTLSAAEFDLLLVGIDIPDGTLPPPTVPTAQRQAALLTWLANR